MTQRAFGPPPFYVPIELRPGFRSAGQDPLDEEILRLRAEGLSEGQIAHTTAIWVREVRVRLARALEREMRR